MLHCSNATELFRQHSIQCESAKFEIDLMETTFFKIDMKSVMMLGGLCYDGQHDVLG